MIAELLGAASDDGATLTGLVYRTNSNFTRTKKYVDFLLKKGYLERGGPGSKKYRTTTRGREAGRILKDVVEIILKAEPTYEEHQSAGVVGMGLSKDLK